jgi:hypothetical protein
MASYGLFGLDPLPFRIVTFATQFANLVLVAAIGTRIAGSRAAGFCAACFWSLNGSLFVPLVWACAYCEPMGGLCLLGAFYFLLRYIETGRKRFLMAQWAAFVIGFGALELVIVYPAVAAVYTGLRARPYFLRSLWLFAGSAAYYILHSIYIPPAKAGLYAMHVSGAIFRTLSLYWSWSLRPAGLQAPRWVMTGALLLLTLALAAFAIRKLRQRNLAPLFCIAWYLIVISPLLLLRDHPGEYYVYLPVVGICWLGGWAVAESWRAGNGARVVAAALAGVYILLSVPHTWREQERNQRLTARVRNLVEGVAGAHERHPTQDILLAGVDTDLFWNAVRDRPFRLLGTTGVYLAPGSEHEITAYPERGDVAEFVAPTFAAAGAIADGKLAVYDVRGPRLRNITSSYTVPRDAALPRRIDAGSPLTESLLGTGWYPADGNIRWMSRRASLRIGAPTAAGQGLYLRGICPREQWDAGPVRVTVTAGGLPLPPQELRPGNGAFELAFELPPALAGRPEIEITVDAGRTIRVPSDPRDFGLAFGIFEVK